MSTWAALPNELKLVILNRVLYTIIDEAVDDHLIMFDFLAIERATPKLTALRRVFPDTQNFLFNSLRKELVATEDLIRLRKRTDSESYRALCYRREALNELIEVGPQYREDRPFYIEDILRSATVSGDTAYYASTSRLKALLPGVSPLEGLPPRITS